MSERQAQADRILARLERGPATSLELQRLDPPICCHTKRISELRADGQPITTAKEKRSGRWIFTYTLEGHSTAVVAPMSDHERPEQVQCANCGKEIVRKAKARPLRPGEDPACSNACRAENGRRKRAGRQAELFTSRTSFPQDLPLTSESDAR